MDQTALSAARAATLEFNNAQVTTIRNYTWEVSDILGVISGIADTETKVDAEVKAMGMVFGVLATDKLCQLKAREATLLAAALTEEEFSTYHEWCIGQTVVTTSQISHALKESMDNFKINPEDVLSALGAIG